MRLFLLSCLFALLCLNARAELEAGVAKADITPPIGGEMAGYSARGAAVSTGVHDPLFAKAIVLDDGARRVAIVTLDLAGFSADSTARVKEKVKSGGGPEHLLLISSHTHSGPALSDEFPSKEKPWIRDAEEKIARAILAAADSTQAAKIGIGWGEVREGHNRRRINADGTVTMLWANRERIPTAPVDYQLAIIRVDSLDDKPIATLVNFTCHPVVLGPENLEISADYPGVFMARVESEVGGQCMFVQGAAGDINPFWDKTPPREGAFEEMTKMGEAIAREAIRVRSGIKNLESSPQLSIEVQNVPLGKRWDLESAEVQSALKSRYGEAVLKRYMQRYSGDLVAEIHTVTIGEGLAIAGFPGEFFVEHGLNLKKRSPVKDTIFAGYCNGLLGYFPTIKAATEGGYGAAENTIVEVGAGERLVDLAIIQLYEQTGKLSPLPGS
jgi:neutral ceramidase